MNNTRLYRSQTDEMIGGVCGGLAQYLNLDSTLIRLFFILLALGDGIGVMLYFILWIVLPAEEEVAGNTLGENVQTGANEIADRARSMGEDLSQSLSRPNPERGKIIGIGLIIAGSIYLLQAFNIPWLGWLSFDNLWPVLLIVAGVALIIRQIKE